MEDRSSYIVLLLPEILLLAGVILLSLASRYRKAEGRPGKERAFRIGGILLFPIVLLLVLMQGVLLDEAGLRGALRFLPIESSSSGDTGLLILDPLSIFFKAGIALLGLIAATSRILPRAESNRSQENALRFRCGLLGCTLGAFLLAGANDLLIVWGGVEILMLSARLSAPTEDARVKAYRYGGFFSGLTLFGVLLVYGMFGTTELFGIANTLSARNAETVPTNGLLIASLFIFGGIASRIGGGLVEILRGTFRSLSLGMLAFFVMTLLTGFVLSVRLSIGIFPPDLQGVEIGTLLIVLWGMVGIVCASLAAGTNNLYHGISYAAAAHLGIALLPLASRSGFGLIAGTAYLTMHLLLTLGAALGIRSMCGEGWDGTIETLRGGRRRNQIPDLFTFLLLLALAGVPFTGGFLARFFLFDSLLEAKNLSPLAVLPGIIASTLLLYAYGRWLHALYLPALHNSMRNGSTDGLHKTGLDTTRRGRLIGSVLGLCAAATIVCGFPGAFRLLWNAIRLSLGHPEQ